MSGANRVEAQGGAAQRGGGRWRPGPRLQLVLIITVFVLPLVAAFLWRPTGYVNHGDLVDPARPLRDVGLRTPAGDDLPLSALRPSWLLLYVGSGSCEAPCRQNLYKMRQVRLGQGDDAQRVSYVYVTQSTLPAAEREWLEAEHPGVITLLGGSSVIDRLSAQLRSAHDSPQDAVDRVYVVDPLGNLMMSYGPEADPTAMRKDLVRLLRVSQIG